MSDTVAVPIADLRRLHDYVHRVHYGYFTGPDREKHIKDAAGPMWALTGGLLEAGKQPLVHEPFQSDDGATYTAWTDGAAVGFKVTFPESDRAEYVYLNPSGGSDDGVNTVFLYQGDTGDSSNDSAVIHLTVGADRNAGRLQEDLQQTSGCTITLTPLDPDDVEDRT